MKSTFFLKKLYVVCMQNEVIKPAVEGIVGILKSCKEAGTVKRVVFTSSASAVGTEEHLKPVYDETCWSDIEFCRRDKITGWVWHFILFIFRLCKWNSFYACIGT